MKIKTLIATLAVALVAAAGPVAINGQSIDPAFLLNPSRSVTFGWDIYINDQPAQNQKNAAICSAFNGWLYATLSYPYEDLTYLQFYRSKDSGETWELLISDFVGGVDVVFRSMELVTTGNSLENLRLLFGFIVNDTSLNTSYANVFVYDGVTMEGLGVILDGQTHHAHNLALASDYLFPATGSHPGSIAVLYSKETDYGIDSLVFCSSSNGGMSIDKSIALKFSNNKYFGNLDLSYGYSPSFSSGRYFAVWEEKENAGDLYGHIYTAHTNPNFNSPFTNPVCLDSLFPDAIGKCRNPVIACQQSSYDNDSANFTEVILFERFNTSTQKYDIVGCYNKRAASGTTFTPFELTGNENEELQPDITFNPFDSSFLVTYFNKTEQKLPFLANNVNMTDPGNWQVRSSGYNDSTNLVDPHPRITLNPVKQAGATVWLAQRGNGNGAAMYDAEYIYYTGLPEKNGSESVQLFGIRPNPCTDQATIVFELKKATTVKIDLFSITGKHIETVTDQVYRSGVNEAECDVSDLPQGSYLYSFSTDEFRTCGRMVVVK